MFKVIDLDQAVRDGEGLVLTLTINGEKVGFIDQDVVELLRAKHGGSAKAAKRAPAKKATPATEVANASEASSESPVEESERELEELAAAH